LDPGAAAIAFNRSFNRVLSVNGQWRVVFIWHDDGGYAVEIGDYL
jgi:plasmid maintenance system killer protein